MKVRRRAIEERYRHLIEDMYEKAEGTPVAHHVPQ
jgi:hypothetical protein